MRECMEQTINCKLHQCIYDKGVMVVDDSSLQRNILISILQSCGSIPTTQAMDGRNALTQLRKMQVLPAVVVIDLEMPVMDGIQLIQQLAEHEINTAIIVASSADIMLMETVQMMASMLDLPMLGIIEKPFTPAKIFAALSRFNQVMLPIAKRAHQPKHISSAMLQRAIEKNGIVPFYQPKIALQDGTVTGLEALARWPDSEFGMIMPAEFIPLAEQTGLVRALTLAMLDSVLVDLRNWQQRGLELTVAINISGVCLSDKQMADDIILRVKRAAISPHSLVLEITESALAADIPAALAALSRLRLKGFGLSLDDYGTGFSSMQQLARAPFTELKIDRTFVREASTKTQVRTILQSAIEMGTQLGLTTLAEGVEEHEELQLLKSLGCKLAQGYLLGRPIPGGEIVNWLEANKVIIETACNSKYP